MPSPAPGRERRPVLPKKKIPSTQKMVKFEKQEMKNSRLVVKNSELYDWLLDYAPKSIKKAVKKSFLRTKNSVMSLCDSAKETLKDIVEREAKEGQQQEEYVDLTPHKHERALKGAYRYFVMSGKPKTDVDSYFYQAKPQMKTLIENQLKEMGGLQR